METIIVVLIVCMVTGYFGRFVYRTLTNQQNGCGCGEKVCASTEHCSPQESSKGNN